MVVGGDIFVFSTPLQGLLVERDVSPFGLFEDMLTAELEVSGIAGFFLHLSIYHVHS